MRKSAMPDGGTDTVSLGSVRGGASEAVNNDNSNSNSGSKSGTQVPQARGYQGRMEPGSRGTSMDENVASAAKRLAGELNMKHAAMNQIAFEIQHLAQEQHFCYDSIEGIRRRMDDIDRRFSEKQQTWHKIQRNVEAIETNYQLALESAPQFVKLMKGK